MEELGDDYDIPDYLVHGADEMGMQTEIGVTECVIGPAGAKMQHQQRAAIERVLHCYQQSVPMVLQFHLSSSIKGRLSG